MHIGMWVVKPLNSLGMIMMLLVRGFASRWMGVLSGRLMIERLVV